MVLIEGDQSTAGRGEGMLKEALGEVGVEDVVLTLALAGEQDHDLHAV